MALDTTRGLPSFSEMYVAMKNRGSLGEALKTGFEGYRSGVKANMDADTAKAERDLKAAQAKEALSKANADPMKDYTDIRNLAPNLSKEQYDTLASTATQVGDKLMVKKSEVANMIPLVREQGTERRAELARLEAEKARAAADEKQANLIKSIADRQERAIRAGDVRQEKQQALTASGAVLGEAEKRAPLSKATDYIFNTDRQRQIKQAQKVREDALNALQPGETMMLNPKTGELVAVNPDEIPVALSQGLQHYTPK